MTLCEPQRVARKQKAPAQTGAENEKPRRSGVLLSG